MSGQTFTDAQLDYLLPRTPPKVVAVTAAHSGSPWTAVALSPPAGVARCFLAFDAAAAAFEVRFDGASASGHRVPANTPWVCPWPLDLTGLTVEVRTTGGADVEVRTLVSFPAR